MNFYMNCFLMFHIFLKPSLQNDEMIIESIWAGSGRMS